VMEYKREVRMSPLHEGYSFNEVVSWW